MYDDLIGKKVIVRFDRAGVIYGTLDAVVNNNVKLLNARKIFYWSGASAVEQIATDGIKNIENSKVTLTVGMMIVSNYLQILPCTEKAILNIESHPEWKQ